MGINCAALVQKPSNLRCLARFPLGLSLGCIVSSKTKRSAKIMCRGGSVWISPRQFWKLVRENLVEYLSEPPLTGRFRGQASDFLITVNHTVLSMACPEHRSEVLLAKRYARK